jgi:hypothetical protein
MKELDLLPEQLSLFSVLSSTATGMSGARRHRGRHHLHFDDEPEIPEPDEARAADDALDLPEMPTDAGFPLTGAKSVAERKEELREQEHGARQALVDLTGFGHAKVQIELNRLAGIMSVGSATNSERRLRRSNGARRHGQAWLRRR